MLIEGKENLYKVYGAEFVSIDDGSGILHVAPAFGEDDLMLGKQHNIPVLITVDENGHVKTDLGLPMNLLVNSLNKLIILSSKN